MLVAKYATKSALKEAVGQSLHYEETSLFAATRPEHRADGTFPVVGPGAYDRKWFAEIEMRAGKIARVR